MPSTAFRRRLKPWMLPIAMGLGIALHNYIGHVAFLAPWLIFVMLFVTFCRVRPSAVRFTAMTWRLLAVQLAGAVAVYFIFRPLGPVYAQGALICVFCPTATAAPVITGMLGGSVETLVAYSLVSNAAAAVTAPALFAVIDVGNLSFGTALWAVGSRVVPLMLAPLVAALLLRRWWPRGHAAVSRSQGLSFYVWAVSLCIVVGQAVSFVMAEPLERVWTMVALAFIAGVLCLALFVVGRRIGAYGGDRVAGAQGLAQKNTVLAIWMALNYMDPLASVAPAAYIAWQNTVNSLQLYLHLKSKYTKPQ